MVAPIRDAATVPLEAPALVAGAGTALWLGLDGAVLNLSLPDAALRARHGPPPILCHAPLAAKRLGIARFAALDVLELHAFVRPTRACVPTVRGLAAALGLERPRDLAAEVQALPAIARALLSELASLEERDEAALIADRMAAAGWSWGTHAVAALERTGAPGEAEAARPELAGFAVWRKLPSWSEHAPESPPGSQPVLPTEARRRLVELLARDRAAREDAPETRSPVEPRPQQADYASAVTAAFTPRERRGVPRFVLAEAGTGVGKTLGYIAPASLWAEKNGGPVWISTYTRNLQHQIDGELDRLHPDPLTKARRVVIRKGRENYLCLLNMDEAVAGARLDGREVIALGLIARWAAETRDGDMIGGDFPSWLADLVGRARTLDLRDHRGECVYSACPHYHKCFIEGSIRRARRAEIVVANHALVMAQAALGGLDDGTVPQRYVFDEGHHVFDAADGAFSAYLSGAEMAELRRWVLGREDRRRSRARGLKRRTGDLALGDAEAEQAIEEAESGARALPDEGWPTRVTGPEPRGPAERFLALVRETVYARAPEPLGPYGLECEPRPTAAGLLKASAALE
ncbi:MAG: ATP-dependent DNA helicase, partial [Alphaproteobacteria bacterium]